MEDKSQDKAKVSNEIEEMSEEELDQITGGHESNKWTYNSNELGSFEIQIKAFNFNTITQLGRMASAAEDTTVDNT